MCEIFDNNAPKKSSNLWVNNSLPSQPKSSEINLSATLKRALKALENCNLLTESGLFSAKHRGF